MSRVNTTIHVDDGDVFDISDHLANPGPGGGFVRVRLGGMAADLYLDSVSQAIELRDAAQHAVDAFVLAGEPVTA